MVTLWKNHLDPQPLRPNPAFKLNSWAIIFQSSNHRIDYNHPLMGVKICNLSYVGAQISSYTNYWGAVKTCSRHRQLYGTVQTKQISNHTKNTISRRRNSYHIFFFSLICYEFDYMAFTSLRTVNGDSIHF